MDAIEMLKEDHQRVEELFQKFEQAGEGAKKERRYLVDRIVKDLSVHAAIEEEAFYPATREARGEAAELVEEAEDEHQEAKKLLAQLETMDPEDERFDALVEQLIDDVRHHVQEEEGEIFPLVAEAMDETALAALAEDMREAKRNAPESPSEAQKREAS